MAKKDESDDVTKIINFKEITDKLYPGDKIDENHFLAPQGVFRMAMIGPSGSGKTNAMINLLTKMLKYDHVFLYAKDLDEPLYRFLKDFYEDLREEITADNVKKLVKEKLKESGSKITDKRVEEETGNLSEEELESCEEKPLITCGNKIEDIVDIDSLDRDGRYIMIFDDFLTERDQKKIEDVFIRGRKRGVSVFYLSQRFADIPKKIRSQCNYFAIFDQDDDELRTIARKQAGMGFKKFAKLYRAATREPHNFLMIDKRTTVLPLRYRQNFDGVYTGDDLDASG